MGLWGKAGQRSLQRSALAEAAEQFTPALNLMPSTSSVRREQIKLQVSLVTSLTHIKGWAAAETKAAVEQARLLLEQAEPVGDAPEDPLLLFSVLFGFWVTNTVAFDADVSRDVAAQFLALAKKQKLSGPAMLGRSYFGASSFLLRNS